MWPSGKSARNRPKIVAAALVDSCWLTIEPASALLTGLPEGVVEKNRDTRLLSPSALLDAAVGKNVELLRTNRKDLKPEIVGNIEAGLKLSAEDVGRAETARAELARRVAAFFQRYGLLVTPAVIVPPFAEAES